MKRVANDGQKSPHSNRSDTIGWKEAFARKKTIKESHRGDGHMERQNKTANVFAQTRMRHYRPKGAFTQKGSSWRITKTTTNRNQWADQAHPCSVPRAIPQAEKAIAQERESIGRSHKADGNTKKALLGRKQLKEEAVSRSKENPCSKKGFKQRTESDMGAQETHIQRSNREGLLNNWLHRQKRAARKKNRTFKS